MKLMNTCFCSGVTTGLQRLEILALFFIALLLFVPQSQMFNAEHETLTCALLVFAQTTKERSMWSCEWRRRPVEIHVTLSHVPRAQLAAVRLWNYNKALAVSSAHVIQSRVLVTCTCLVTIALC